MTTGDIISLNGDDLVEESKSKFIYELKLTDFSGFDNSVVHQATLIMFVDNRKNHPYKTKIIKNRYGHRGIVQPES